MRRISLALFLLPAFLLTQIGCGGSGGGGGITTQNNNPTPAVRSITPASVTAGAPAQTVTVTGDGFVASSVVTLNGVAVSTVYVSATSLQAQVPASALAAGATVPLSVTNPGGQSSAAASFQVMSPTPALSSVSPNSIPQSAPVTLTINGTGFEANSVVLWNGSPRPTTFVNATTLKVALTQADVQQIGNSQITITNPGPGGTTTQPTPEVVYAVPAISSLAPSSVQAGAGPTTLTINGVNFATNSVVQLDGVPLATTFVSATQLTAQIAASSLLTVRTAAVTVTNNTPVAVISASAPFGVNSPPPTLTALAPAGVAQGAPDTAIMLSGSNFVNGATASWNGAALTTTFVSTTQLKATIPAADLATAGSGTITVTNPGTSGSISSALTFMVVAPPVITGVSPTYIQLPASGTTSSTTVTVTGSNFSSSAKVYFNNNSLPITSQTATQVVATISSQMLYQTGALPVYVTNPATVSAGVTVSSKSSTINVINPSATFTFSPNSAAVGSPDTKITVQGSGFFADSVVQWNGSPLPTTYSSTNSLSAVIPAADLAVAGSGTISIATPENMGQATPTSSFNTYLAMPINALAYNAADGLLYATVAGAGGPGLGNSLVGIDPVTGVVQKTIFVGSEPTKLALSTDGTQAFVGLNGAGAVRQVNLLTGTAGIQFSLGGTQGIYVPPFTASALATLPGQPNSIAVYGSNGVVTIYDAGVPRPKASSGLNTYFNSNLGAMTFGPSASTLYLVASTTGSYVYQLTVDSTGITASKQLTSSAAGVTVQYDNGHLYTPNGVVSDPSTGATLGQFSTTSTYSTGNAAATGPIASDSSLNRAWVVLTNFGSASTQLIAYDEKTFLPVATTTVNGINAVQSYSTFLSNPADLVRWGQDGLAFHTANQLFLLHGAMVKDTSATPADLQVSVQLPSTVTTGTAFTYQVQVKNLGTSSAAGVVLATRLPETLLYGSSTVSQGSCNGAGILYCNLGSLANGATATVSITTTPSSSGTSQVSAAVDSQTYDPVSSNNTAVATTTVSGSLFGAVPTATSLSPNLIATGASTTTLTINGTGFNSGSIVNWNGTTLPTTFVNSTQVTAAVDGSLLKQIGWGAVSVSNPAPGGGTSGNLIVSVYGLLSVPANAVVYDPYIRKLLAVLPSTSTTLAGNSLVTVDPTTGTTGTPIKVGSEPTTVAESPGGNFVYIGLSGAKSLARFNVGSQTVDATIPLSSGTFFPIGPVAATGLAAIPGVENSVAVDNVGIFDFNGTSATQRPNSSLGFDDAVFPDSSHAFTYDNGSTGAEISRYNVDSNGVHLIDGSTLLGMGGFSGSLALDQGLIFGSGGGIADPRTTPITQIGVLPLGVGPYGTGLSGAGALPYQATKKDFVLGINSAGTWLVFLERFDTQHFTFEDSIQLPTANGIVESVPGTRFGQDGIALLITGGVTSSAQTQLMLLRGAFVLPSEAVASKAPTLTSVGTGSLAAGGGNQLIRVVGTGFIPGASVLWNGVAYTTTYVDAQHLNVAVGSGDISTKGNVNVTVQNPGSSASNAVTLTIL